MPSSLSSVIKRIESLSSDENKKLIYSFVDFMKNTDISEKYQKDNLFVIILYARYLGTRNLFDVDKKQDITEFLDTRRKDTTIDPDQKWIRTWNDYLQRIKYFMRWFHNQQYDTDISDWQTPSFVQIRKKKSNRISPYTESELWERDDLLTVVKYEARKRNRSCTNPPLGSKREKSRGHSS